MSAEDPSTYIRGDMFCLSVFVVTVSGMFAGVVVSPLTRISAARVEVACAESWTFCPVLRKKR